MPSKIKHLATACSSGLLGWLTLAASVQAQQLDLSDTPLFTQNSVQPNIFFVFDDSGSMDWESTLNEGTDSPGGAGTEDPVDHTPESDAEARELCPGYNTMAYSPDREYTPWKGTDVNNAAYPEITALTGTVSPYNNGPLLDPYDGHGNGNGSNMADLSDHVYFEWTDSDSDGEYDNGECPALPLSEDAADNSACKTLCDETYPGRRQESERNTCYASCDATYPVFTLDSCRSASGCKAVVDLSTDQQQNYAQWYTYYRKRTFVAQRAVTELVNDSSARVGLGTFHDNNNIGTVITDMTVDTNKQTLLKNVGNISPNGGTPLRQALYEAGEYFKSGTGAIFGTANPGTPILSADQGGACQQNFSILMSDGFANQSLSVDIGNRDADGGTGTDNTIFDGGIYADEMNNTIADVAMMYFEEDISDLNNEVPESTEVNNGDINNDMHQHMVTYTVAFGIFGNLNCNPADDSCPETWPYSGDADTYLSGRETVDDLMHAAVNGRGEFLNANNPDTLIASLEEAIADIEARDSASAAVASNSTSLNTGTVLYQARFNTGDWHGDLISSPISTGATDTRASCTDIPAGEVCPIPNWSAGTDENGINSQLHTTDRRIVTYKPSTGKAIPFRWPANYNSPGDNEMDTTQTAALLANAPSGEEATYGANLVNYLRGDRSNELASDGTSSTSTAVFRYRENSVLGDIVNSAPQFVGVPNFNFPDSLETEPYSDFEAANESRREMVYVGANDGMLHAFDANTGETVYSYVPRASYTNLETLAQPDYEHKYFVDGTPTVGDAFFSDAWHTVLLGTHLAGGQGVFALDITDPTKLTETQEDIDSVFMWEFQDNDLGYTYSQPDIVKLNDGRWVTIFGNGYNNSEADGSASTTGYAYLYVLDLAGGSQIAKLSTNTGSVGTPNGLNTATPVDINGDYKVDYVYAGDLLGNLWRFDLRSTDSSTWSVMKVFTATAPGTGATQPITSRPSAGFHPDASLDGLLVYFGTGRYIDVSDGTASGQETQTFYAIWDQLTTTPPPALDRTSTTPNYLQRSIISQILIDVDEDGIGEANTDNDASDDTVVRVTSDDSDTEGPIDWDTHYGWFIDLINTDTSTNPDGNNYGERQVTDSVVRSDRIVFTTTLPDEIACNFGGTSFLMELDSSDGSPLEGSPVDVNDDGVIDEEDLTYGDLTLSSVSGIGYDGILTEPTIIGSTDADIEYKVFNSSTGATETIAEEPPGGLTGSRMSWNEISE